MNSKPIHALNHLIENCKDGELGFRSCAEHVRSANLRQIFTQRANERLHAAAELQTLVAQFGGDAEDSGTASGALHRGWVAVKGSLSGYSDLAMLEECERGEDVSLERYRDALEAALPDSVRPVVERQYEMVKASHLQVRTMRDQLKAGGVD